MPVDLLLLIAAFAWLLVLLLAVSLCRAAKEGDKAMDNAYRAAAADWDLEHSYHRQARQPITSEPREDQPEAHPRPTRTGLARTSPPARARTPASHGTPRTPNTGSETRTG